MEFSISKTVKVFLKEPDTEVVVSNVSWVFYSEEWLLLRSSGKAPNENAKVLFIAPAAHVRYVVPLANESDSD